MLVRRLNSKGIDVFSKFLDSCDSDEPETYPEYLLQSDEHTEAVRPDVKIEKKNFFSRYEAAKYLVAKLDGKGLNNIEYDKGLWTWLALYYFERICEKNNSGLFLTRNIARWVLSSDYKTYYRHLLAGPYRIYRVYQSDPEIALAILITPVNKPGEVVEQIASRQMLVSNKRVVQAATAIYVDSEEMTIKTGAASKGGGSARRFADVMMQCDATWDLYLMDSEEIINLLPAEFDRFID